MSDDLISRQAAIDALHMHLMYRMGTDSNKKRLDDWINGLPSAQPIQTASNYLQSLPTSPLLVGKMPSAQPEPQWIPCSERLPEEKDAGILKKLGVNKRSDHVLATVKAKGEYMTVQTCTYDGVWHWDMKYAFPDYEIIAWMPLPEPYKERREE